MCPDVRMGVGQASAFINRQMLVINIACRSKKQGVNALARRTRRSLLVTGRRPSLSTTATKLKPAHVHIHFRMTILNNRPYGRRY